MNKLITIIIPCYNEEEVLHILYERLDHVVGQIKNYNFEFLLINDGSRDSTLEKIRALSKQDSRISYISLSRNFGKEIAMLAGFDYCKGDAAIIIDADLQDPPELFSEMIQYWEEGYEDVFAKRKSRAGESFLKKFTSHAFYRILKHATRIPLQEDTGDFRLLDRRCIEALKTLREKQRYTKGLFSWVGYHKKEILYDRQPRAAGTTKWNYLKLVDLAIEGITSFTTAPLRLSTVLGICVSMISFVYLIILLAKTIIYGDPVVGYPSMMAVILFLGGVQLLSIGIIGEYVGRIFNETKQRPVYLVDEYNGEKI